MKKSFILMLSLVFLAACSMHYGSNGESLYKKSRNGQLLRVPPPLTDANVSHFYDLPPQNSNSGVSIVPPVD